MSQFSILNTSSPCLGWIGTGMMGGEMLRNLVSKTNLTQVFVYNRTISKAEVWTQKLNLILEESPKCIAQKANLIFVMLGTPKDVQAILDGTNGLIENMQTGGIICDLTTSEPSLAIQMTEKAKKRGIYLLDCPVSGGTVGAINGNLVMMVGGDLNALDAIRSKYLATMTSQITYFGSSGNGQHCKMANQILIATNMIGVVEAILYSYRAKLDLNAVLETVSKGAAGSWSISHLGPRIVQHDYKPPGFLVDHFVKDLGIALKEARSLNLDLPGLKLANSFYEKAQKMGLGQMGTQALMKVFEDLNQIEFS